MPFFVRKIGKNMNGLTTLFNGLLYWSTNLSKPTLFESEEEARKYIDISKDRWPEVEFEVVFDDRIPDYSTLEEVLNGR